MTEHPEFAIDLDRIVAQKTGGRGLPRPVMAFLKRFVHLDFVNSFLTKGYQGPEFCRECLKYLDVTIEVEGLEHLDLLPEGARATVVSNHPLGGIDGIALLEVLSRKWGDGVRLLVNDVLMHVHGIAPISVGVNKFGAQARDLRQQVEAMFDSPWQMLVFPAGACSRRIDGRIQDYPWRKTFVTESVRTGRYVVPVHFLGENSRRFYRVSSICKALGIKFNLAMLFLPDELWRGQHKTFKVIIGKPIPPDSLDGTHRPYEWAQIIRQNVYDL